MWQNKIKKTKNISYNRRTYQKSSRLFTNSTFDSYDDSRILIDVFFFRPRHGMRKTDELVTETESDESQLNPRNPYLVETWCNQCKVLWIFSTIPPHSSHYPSPRTQTSLHRRLHNLTSHSGETLRPHNFLRGDFHLTPYLDWYRYRDNLTPYREEKYEET